jgi:hypothetical protein
MNVKDAAATVQSIVTTLAIIAGGIWFMRQGSNRPRLKIQHNIAHKAFNDGSKKVHVVAEVLISNVGNVVVEIPCGRINVKQVLPAPTPGHISATVLQKPDHQRGNELCSFQDYTIEPGEGDQVYSTFDVDDTVQAIQFDSFIPNQHKPNEGWGLQSFYDLSASSAGNTKSSYQDATPPQNPLPLLHH